MTATNTQPSFDCCAGPISQGYAMTFANGYTISVRWGCFNYCDNRDMADRNWTGMIDDKHFPTHSPNAEVAVYIGDDLDNMRFIVPDDMKDRFSGDVAGYMTPDDVARLIGIVAALPKSE